MRTLDNAELHRLRHVLTVERDRSQYEGRTCAVQHFDMGDTLVALEELVALRNRESAAERERRENGAIIEARLEDAEAASLDFVDAVSRLTGALERLRDAVAEVTS